MPDLKKKPGEMEFIGGNGSKAAMFQSVKQELKGDDGKSGAQSDLWIIGAIVVGLYLVVFIVTLIVRMLKKSARDVPVKENDQDEDNSNEDEELFYEDLDLEELERKRQLEREQYLSGLSEEEKQELRRQIEKN